MDLLDLSEPPSTVCSITVISTVEKVAVETDCDSDCSDREYQGETDHLPLRLLNGDAEVNYLKDEADVHLIFPDQPRDPLTPTAPPPHLSLLQQSVLRKTHCHCLVILPERTAEKGDALKKMRPHNTEKGDALRKMRPHNAIKIRKHPFKICKIGTGFFKDHTD